MDSEKIYQLVTHLPTETKVSIESKDGRVASVIVDGMDFSKATEIVYRHKAGQEPELTVKFAVGEMKLDSICEVKIKN